MSLPPLNARMSALRVVAAVPSNPVDTVLDNFYALLTNAGGAFPTYADGTPRTPGTFAAERTPGVFTPEEVVTKATPTLSYGSGSALTGSTWTWTREIAGGKTVAIIGAPPATATTFGQKTRIIIAGDAAGTTPAKRASIGGVQDIADGAHRIWFGFAKNVVPGAIYNGWANAEPWQGCHFGGYTRWGYKGDAYANTHAVRVIETQETCWFQIIADGTAVFGAVAGAAIDPETGYGGDAETDGRLYFVSTSGSGGWSSPLVSNWLNVTNVWGILLFETGTEGQAHSYSYTPGSANIVACSRIYNSNAGTLNLVTRDGRFPRVGPFIMGNPNNWAGRLREVQIVRDGTTQQAFTTGAVLNGYTFAHHPSVAGDCLLLQY